LYELLLDSGHRPTYHIQSLLQTNLSGPPVLSRRTCRQVWL